MSNADTDGSSYRASPDLCDAKLHAAIAGNANTGDQKTDEIVKNLAETLLKVPNGRRASMLNKVIADLDMQREEKAATLAGHRAELEALKEEMAHLQELDAWVDALPDNPTIELNDCSRLHKFKEATRNNRLVGGEYQAIKTKAGFIETLQHTFIVKHDWARAFEHAAGMGDNLTDGVRIPYDLATFEFRVAGRTLICMAFNVPENMRDGEFNHPVGYHTFAEAGPFWISMGHEKERHPLLDMLWMQIRSICIALDAEVATSTVVRQSAKLNKKRLDNGKLPLLDYHVVDLARRIGIANPAPSGATHRSPRMHFVRGHWRHLEETKVWIKWHLRGNPELGYIQKHYAL